MIPGVVIAILTFPGVIVHEFAHRFFCDLTATPVRRVCYFRFGNPSGFVVHDTPASSWKHILIGIGPLFVNSATGFALGLLAPVIGAAPEPVQFLWFPLVWLAISIGMHSFPSTGDARGIWRALRSPGTPAAAVVAGTPLVGFLYLGALGSMVWLDLAYGYLLVFTLPAFLKIT